MSCFEFTTPLEIRFPDLDAYQHVNNAMIFVYIETAWTKMYRHYLGSLLTGEVLFVIAHVECDYRQSISLDDTLFVTITCTKVGNSSMDFSYQMHDGQGRTYVEASNVMVCLDPKDKRPVSVPDKLRAVLIEQQEESVSSC